MSSLSHGEWVRGSRGSVCVARGVGIEVEGQWVCATGRFSSGLARKRRKSAPILFSPFFTSPLSILLVVMLDVKISCSCGSAMM